MKHILSVLAICLVAACGAASGGDVTTSTSGGSLTPGSQTSPATPSNSNPGNSPPANTPPSPGNPSPPPGPPINISQAPSNAIAPGLNNVRAQNGASPVKFDGRLARAAQRHADDMLANNFFSHTGSDGSNVRKRVKDAGYNWRFVGENIAWGQGGTFATEGSVLTGWTNSPGHHRNNINPKFEDFALAKAQNGSKRYWVLVLATEK